MDGADGREWVVDDWEWVVDCWESVMGERGLVVDR